MPSSKVHWLLRFYTGKRVVIEDARLGLLLWGFRILLLWFYLNDLINNQGHLDVTNVESAKANFWANVGDLYKVQARANPQDSDSPWNAKTGYCNQQYWAIPSECKHSSTDPQCFTGTKPANESGSHYTCDGIFCEMDWQCISSDFSQLNIKGEQMMSFITTNKDYKKTIGSCSEITPSVCQQRGETYQKSPNEYQCSCISMENQFNVGVEEMTLNFQHMFTPSAASGIHPDHHNVCGAKDVDMFLWASQEDGSVKLIKAFDRGAPAKYPVKKWLEMVGVNSLDDRNVAANQGGFEVGKYGRKITDEKLVGYETFRMTGVGIGIDVRSWPRPRLRRRRRRCRC